jgi:hypothetical protein
MKSEDYFIQILNVKDQNKYISLKNHLICFKKTNLFNTKICKNVVLLLINIIEQYFKNKDHLCENSKEKAKHYFLKEMGLEFELKKKKKTWGRREDCRVLNPFKIVQNVFVGNFTGKSRCQQCR